MTPPAPPATATAATLASLEGRVFDVVVAGAGGAGMTAALCAAVRGLDVLLVERTALVGGTTAFSAGSAWVPNTHLAEAVGSDDSREKAALYLRHAVGDESDEEMRAAFLDTGPEAIAFLEAKTAVKFRAKPLHPDYYSHLPGSTLCGRCLEPVPFDGNLLGDALRLLRPSLPEFTVFGMPVDQTDVQHLLKLHRSPRSFLHASRIMLRYAGDLARRGRSTRLVLGGALIGRLLYSLRERNVPILLETSITGVARGSDGIDGVTLSQGGKGLEIGIRRGLILASGGFNRHEEMRRALLRHPLPVCPGAPGHTGELHDLVRQLGAAYGRSKKNNGFWAPVTVARRKDGSKAVFPLFHAHRGRPGFIIVNRSGRRFVNEALSYHPFVQALYDANDVSPCLPAYLVTDSVGLHKYGLGMVRPRGWGRRRLIREGSLVSAPSLIELAQRLAIDPDGLAETVAKMNEYAATGVDPEFGRGTTDYQRITAGDRTHGPNPCLGPIATPPFYAVEVQPGDIGAATGFRTDASSRVLDEDGLPIPRLYACGNDMNSIMGGNYPGPGITIGPGIVFAYAAARHMAESAGTPGGG